MEPTERLVKTWVASARDEEIQQLVADISAEKTTILNVVKALGDYLTSEQDELRTKGVQLLTSVLEKSPPEIINRKTTHVLITFYCSKLEDTETIVPALQGLVSLARLPSCSDEDALSVIRALFSSVNMKAIVQSVRFTVFATIDQLLNRHRTALQSINKEFLTGYIRLVDGEKDPRNLLMAFAIAKVILIEFDISNFVEAMFNITFCYFPITFRPPPNDPYGITTEQLKEALRACLRGTPLFGPMAIPLFLEKILAGSPATKEDTLQTMAVCLPVYGSSFAKSAAKKLWASLRLEIFQPTNQATEAAALVTLQSLIKTIYVDDTSSSDVLEGLAHDACQECMTILREPEKSQAKPAIKVLSAFVLTTPVVARYTLSQIGPRLIQLYTNLEDVANRPSVLLLLSDIVSAARDSVTLMGPKTDASYSNPLLPYKDEVLGIVASGLKTSQTVKPALACLLGLVSSAGLLSDEETGFVVHSVNELLTSSDDVEDSDRDTVLKLLSSMSSTSPHHVKEQTLPLLFGSLPEAAPSRSASAERIKYWDTLSALQVLCQQQELFEILVIRLTTKLELLSSLILDGESRETSAAYAHSILITLLNTITFKRDDGHVDVAKYIDSLVPRLFNIFLHASTSNESIFNDARLIQVAGQIITLIVHSGTQQRQESFAKATFSAFLNGSVEAIASGHHKISKDAPFTPFGMDATSEHKNTTILFSASVIPLLPEVKLPVEDLNVFLATMLHWSMDLAESSHQRTAAWHVIATVINKQATQADFFISNALEILWTVDIHPPTTPTERRLLALQAWIWAGKALVRSGHKSATDISDRLFTLFEDEAVNWPSAKALGEIISTDDILVKSNGCIIKRLFAQKFSSTILPKVLSGARQTENPQSQAANLVALASLIRFTPKVVYAQHLKALLPLLIRGLELPDDIIRLSVIETVIVAAEEETSEQKGPVSEHAASLVTSMLKHITVQTTPSSRVRAAALRYLGILPRVVRYDILHPLKPTVLRELDKVLDDPRRAVRKQAVDTRTIWYKYQG